jgi:hypothetical protein
VEDLTIQVHNHAFIEVHVVARGDRRVLSCVDQMDIKLLAQPEQ